MHGLRRLHNFTERSKWKWKLFSLDAQTISRQITILVVNLSVAVAQTIPAVGTTTNNFMKLPQTNGSTGLYRQTCRAVLILGRGIQSVFHYLCLKISVYHISIICAFSLSAKHGFLPELTFGQSSSASAFLPRTACCKGSASACSTSSAKPRRDYP